MDAKTTWKPRFTESSWTSALGLATLANMAHIVFYGVIQGKDAINDQSIEYRIQLLLAYLPFSSRTLTDMMTHPGCA